MIQLRHLAAVLLTMGCLAAPASAQEKGGGQVAGDLFERGKKAARAGQWEEARDAYQAAWALERSYRVACNLAQVELRLEEMRGAAEHATFCLDHLPADTDEAARERIQQGLARARAEVSSLLIDVDRPGVEVRIDGELIGKSPLSGEVFVDPGEHEVKAVLAGGEDSRSRRVSASKGESVRVILAFADSEEAPPVAPAKVTPPAPADPGPPERKPSKGRPIAIGIAAGATGAALVLTGAFALKFKNANDDAEEILAGARAQLGDPPCPEGTMESLCLSLERANADENKAARRTNGFLIGTALGAVTTVAFVLWWPKHEPRQARVRWSPAVGRSHGGLNVTGRF